jgi:hypothetical protein
MARPPHDQGRLQVVADHLHQTHASVDQAARQFNGIERPEVASISYPVRYRWPDNGSRVNTGNQACARAAAAFTNLSRSLPSTVAGVNDGGGAPGARSCGALDNLGKPGTATPRCGRLYG